MDSQLYRVLFAWKCTSTHHKFAMDALRHLKCETAPIWQNLFLSNIEVYLDGSKSPDTKFKDFRNHVLHVEENYWGGACGAASLWYQRTVETLRKQEWQKAVYCAGVLSHYYTDPIQPLHTAQSDAEGKIHRACEWSISRSYEVLQERLETELGGYPEITLPEGDDWLDQMVKAGAEVARPHYETLVEEYDLEQGVNDPPAGLTPKLQEIIAGLMGHAVSGFAAILDRVFEDAAVTPPKTQVSLLGTLTQLTVPIFWVTRKISHQADRKVVQKMYAELQRTGQISETLPEDDRAIREFHKADFETPKSEPTPSSPVSVPEQEKTTPTKTPETLSFPGRTESNLKFYLDMERPVEAAPSIGPKTAARLKKIGVSTVADLLQQQPAHAAEVLAVRHITEQTIEDWQAQALLVCCIPQLRGHDAQILVACEVRTAEEVAMQDPERLLKTIIPFVNSKEGERVVRSGKAPDLAEVTNWVEWAGQARTLDAA